MDRTNLGQGVSASLEKLSGLRFRKPRKRSSTSRARPATSALDGRDGHEFYQFRTGMPHAAPLDRREDSGTQFVREQFHGWNPVDESSGTGFVFSAGSSGSNARSSDIGAGSVKGAAFDVGDNCSADFGARVFDFESGMEKVSILSSNSSQSSSAQSLGSADSAKAEGTEAILGTGSFYDSNVKGVETGMPVGGSVFSLDGGNVFSHAGVFSFGMSDKKKNNLRHNSSLGSDNDSFYIMNSRKNVNEKSGQLDSIYFAHKSGVKKNTHSSKTSFTSDDGLPGEQTDRTRKIDLENSGNVDCQNSNTGVYGIGSFVKTKVDLDRKSAICSNESSFSSVSKLPEDLRKLKIDISGNGENGNKDKGFFECGSNVNKNKCESKSSSFNSFDGPFSKLHENMEKLNLHSSAGEVHGHTESGFSARCLKKHVQFSQTSSSGIDEERFSKFPGELKKQNLQSSGNMELGNDNDGGFVFSSDVRKNANSFKSSSLNFDESSISKLHDEIGKMNLNASGNGDDSQKSKPGNTWSQHEYNSAFISSNFTSHSGKEDYGSRVAPLQAHNSRGFSAETAFSPSPLPEFQSSAANACFTSMHTVSETPIMEFRSQKKDTFLLTKENLFTGPHRNMTFGMKKEDSKGVRLKKKRDKSRQSGPIHSGTSKQFVSMDKGPEENWEQDSTGEYSPMDYSPYQETLVSNQCSREASVASDENIHLDSRRTSNDSQKSALVGGKEGELFSATEHFDTNEGLLEKEESYCCFRVPSARNLSSESSRVDEMTSGLRKGSLEAKDENVESSIQMKPSFMESESFSYGSSIKQPTHEGGSGFTFTSCLQDASQSNFLFAAPSSVQGPSSASKRSYRRKSRVKGDHESHLNSKVPLASPPSNMFQFPNAHVPTNCKQEQKGSDDGERAGKFYGAKANQESAEEACEKWRLRGNQAYADGNLSKAEDYYSRGVDSLSLKEISKSCSRTLMLCYSNRAATRMSLGRLREALSDCTMAVTIDPSFLRARVRAGNIHLSLGEPADALQHFEKVLQLDKGVKSDQKILLEAVDGLEKTQNLKDLTDQSSIFLTKRTPDDATKALEIISEGLSISPYSEILLEMKAEALVKLRNYEEAIQICEQTLELAEKNAGVTEPNYQLQDNGCSKSMERSHASLWRWRIISKSYFYLGRLEDANELLQKHEKVKPVIDKYWNRYPESSTSFPATVCELLRLKTAGNEAFQAGRHLEAVELYTAALTLNTESRPFTAICFCNRAAAYQALGQVTDAIADCSLAIALDSSYRKAISRRATLYEMIRDYGQAATDLRKLTSLLERSSEDKNSASGALGRSSSNITDLNQALKRLCTVEEEDRKGGILDMYMILGIERSSSATDVRKAYRKAALRHHPDKAGQFLARSENGDDRVWREIAEEVHTNTDRLFKMIGEAYTILVDPSKRLQYDAEEELRTMKKSYGPYGGSSSPKTPASSYSSQYERSTDSRHWRSYGSSHRR